MPQLWVLPALRAVKVPAGGVTWFALLSPQQTTVPFVRMPQVWRDAAAHRGEGARGRVGLAVVVAAPAGDGAVRPNAAVMDAANAQRAEVARGRGGLALVVQAPAREDTTRPDAAAVTKASADGGERAAGGVALPKESDPQQATVPAVRTPQVCSLPALTVVTSLRGGVAWPESSSPQHATVPVRPNPARVKRAGVHTPGYGAGGRRGDRGFAAPSRCSRGGGRAGEAQGKEGGSEGNDAPTLSRSAMARERVISPCRPHSQPPR